MGNQKCFPLEWSYPNKTRNSKTQQSKLQPVLYHASMFIIFRHLLGKKQTLFLKIIKLTIAILDKHVKSFQRQSLLNFNSCEHCWARRHCAITWWINRSDPWKHRKLIFRLHVNLLWWSWSVLQLLALLFLAPSSACGSRRSVLW